MSNKKKSIVENLGNVSIESTKNGYQSGLPWHQTQILEVLLHLKYVMTLVLF